jgi:quercetin dioxygenase-like cupin family protein
MGLAMMNYPQRRIITSHALRREGFEDSEPEVIVLDDLKLTKTLGCPEGKAHLGELWATPSAPAINTYTFEQDDSVLGEQSFTTATGSNLRMTYFEPNTVCGMHRTSSVDYNIIMDGEVYLQVPDGNGGTKETLCKRGDVVIQRGTLHAWRAGPEGARWVSVLVGAKTVVDDKGKELPDVLL